MSVNSLACVTVSTPSTRPSYVEDEPDDEFVVLRIGSPFRYIIHGFDVLIVELQQMRIAVEMQGIGLTYNVFVRNDKAALSRIYPAAMRVKDFLRIEVGLRVIRY